VDIIAQAIHAPITLRMKIGDKYTDEETMDIYRTIRSFMRHLATKLKE
jgi:hypothetical protein